MNRSEQNQRKKVSIDKAKFYACGQRWKVKNTTVFNQKNNRIFLRLFFTRFKCLIVKKGS